MKKIATIILSAVCAVLFAFGLAACKDSNDYVITVKSRGGARLEDVLVGLYNGDTLLGEARTDENGVARITQNAGRYAIWLDDLPRGYHEPETMQYTTADTREITVTLDSSIIKEDAPRGTHYRLGNVMYDFTLVSSKGETYTLSEQFEDTNVKAVVINFWATYCVPCEKEFPALAQAFEDHNADENNKEKQVSLIAVTSYAEDTSAAINTYIAQHPDINFPMAPDVTDPKLSSFFNMSGIPHTVIIDRYGVMAYEHSGMIPDVDTWAALFEKYTSDNYSQDNFKDPNEVEPLEKPDAVMPPSADIEAAINGTGMANNATYRPVTEKEETSEYNGEPMYLYYWPWLVGNDEKGSYIYPSNNHGRQKYSTAFMFADFTTTKDQMLVIEYDISTETSCDYFYILHDGDILVQDSGMGTRTAYAYVALKEGENTISIVYRTDQANESGAVYEDDVRIRSMKLVNVSELPQDEYVNSRYHCTDTPITNDQGVQTGWGDYVKVGPNKQDGYYHLLDGNNQPNGPYVLADLQSGNTHWSNNSIASYLSAGTTELDAADAAKLSQYASYAIVSDVPNYTPVTQELHDILMKLITKKSLNETPGENEWLELCSYYIHYDKTNGETGFNPNAQDPILGCAPFCAVELHETQGVTKDNYEGTAIRIDITRIYSPRGIHAKFVPDHDGLYKFQSYGVNKSGKDYDTLCYITDEDGEEITRRSDAGTQAIYSGHFTIYVNLEAGKTYYVRPDFYMPGEMGTFYLSVERMTEDVRVLRNLTEGIYTYDLSAYEQTGKYYNFPIMLAEDYWQDPLTYNWYVNHDAATTKKGFTQSAIYLKMTEPTIFCDIASIADLLDETENPLESPKYLYMTRDESGDPIPKKDANGNPVYTEGSNGALIPVYEKTFRLDFDFTRNDGFDYRIHGDDTEPSLIANYNEYMKQKLEEAKENDGLVAVDEKLGNVLMMFARRISGWRTPEKQFLDQAPGVINGTIPYEWFGMCYYYEEYKA